MSSARNVLVLAGLTLLPACNPTPRGHADDAPVAVAPPGLRNSQAVIDAASSSSCASHSWNNGQQGVAPRGYIPGVALSYARNYCAFKAGQPGAAQTMSAPPGDPGTDGIAEYAAKLTTLPITTPLERLETDYSLLLGLGMVESSGRTTLSAPFDSANPHPASLTAEAGLYQTSADSLRADPILTQLRQSYTTDPSQCAFDLFTAGTHPPVTPAIGSGDGAAFQQLTKSCPMFATDYAAVMLRVDRHHYGTLNQFKAEYAPVCQTMFKQVEAIADCGP